MRLEQTQLTRYMRDPVAFTEDLVYRMTLADHELNEPYRRLEPETKEIMRAVEAHDRVAVRSGHGISKTATAAWLTLWFLYCFHQARVIVTGPKFDQLKATLWAEIKKWLDRSLLIDEIGWSSEKIWHNASPGTWFGQIFTSNESENLAGQHADHMLIIIDEASGVSDEVLEVLLGAMTGQHNKMLIQGNPTKTSGFHFNAFGKEKHLWHCMQFSSEESKIVSKAWLRQQRDKYNKDSDIYRVRVLGLPPRGNPKAIMPLEDVLAARDRTVAVGDFLEFGVDPASEGDDLTTIAVRQGMKLHEVRTFPKTQAHEVVAQVTKMVREYRAKTGIQSTIRVKVDDIGYGNAVRHYLALNEKDNIEVVPIRVNAKGNEEYSDYGSIIWFNMAYLISKVEIPDDSNLIEELSGREWDTNNGKIKIEKKVDFKKRYSMSPDRADAVVMCFAEGPRKVFQNVESKEGMVREFEVDWEHEKVFDDDFNGVKMVNVLHFVALNFNENLSFSALFGIYEFFKGELWLYKELLQANPIPELINRAVKVYSRAGLYQDQRRPDIVGNEKMFHKEHGRRPLQEALRTEGLVVRNARHYEEFGAIAMGNQLFQRNKIIIHESMKQTRADVALWTVKNGKPDEEQGFCSCLLLMLSEMRQRMKSAPQPRPKPDYKPIYIPREYKKSHNEWMAH